MTLDEAIKHAEEVAIEKDKLCKRYDDASGYTRSHNEEIRTSDAKKCEKCAEEHRQLAEWLKELNQLREQTRWVLCSDRLPEEFAYVFCSTNAGEVFIATYLGKMNDGIDCFDDDNGMMWEGDVIAWMPLPEPYKAESEG